VTWFQDLIAKHTEIALDDEGDRTRLAQLFALTFPTELLTAVLLGSTTAVLKVARAEGAIVSTTNMLELAERVTRNAVQTTIALLLDQNPPRITREDLEIARNAGGVAAARVRAYDAEGEAVELRHALEQAKAEIALLRERRDAVIETTIVPARANRA
jgi:hypothetical protein